MNTKLTWFYKIDQHGFPIAGTLQKFKIKPKSGKWKELGLTNACCGNTSCDTVPVEFKCIPANFYVEFLSENGNLVSGGTYTNDGRTEFIAQIPRGIFSVSMSGFVAGFPVYFNGVLVGNADGSGLLLLEDYDTTNIRKISGCDDNGNIQVEVIFNSTSTSYTNEELSGLVQARFYTADGLTLLGESVLGGGASQNVTLPYGQIKYCVDVPTIFVKDDLNPYGAFQTADNTPGGGSTTIFYDPNTATEVCQSGDELISNIYRINLGDGGGD